MTGDCDESYQGIQPLSERDLIQLSSTESGWVEERPKPSDDAITELVRLLKPRLPAGKVRPAIEAIRTGFSKAAEACIEERLADVNASNSKDAKRPSSKLGVRMRDSIDCYLQEIDAGSRSLESICSSIVNDYELGRLVNMYLEAQNAPARR